MPDSSSPILVTGAAGKQGGATARALLAAGIPVRALVRDPATERARAAGAAPFAVQNDWQNEIGHPARPEYARALGISLTSSADWARAHLTAN